MKMFALKYATWEMDVGHIFTSPKESKQGSIEVLKL